MTLNKDKLMQIIDEALLAFRYRDSQKFHFVDALADGLISNGVPFEADTNVGSKWIAASQKPDKFVSVLGHMTDAGDFPAVRECYWTGEGFFFPALCERHPVDRWMEMPE